MQTMAKKPTTRRNWPRTLADLRERLGLNQTEAAARIHVTQSYWSKMEAGKIVPPAPVAFLIELLSAGKI